MKFYRIHKKIEVGTSAGFDFTTDRRQAEYLKRKHDKENKHTFDVAIIERINISATKKGILSALRKYASHPDNGG